MLRAQNKNAYKRYPNFIFFTRSKSHASSSHKYNKSPKLSIRKLFGVSSQQETAEVCEVSSRRAAKRGRPKSERKELDEELFKRLKADSSGEVDRHDFLEKFKKG